MMEISDSTGHSTPMKNMYNYFTTEKGKSVILKGWKKAGVIGVLDGSIVLQSEDPFKTIYTNTECVVMPMTGSVTVKITCIIK